MDVIIGSAAEAVCKATRLNGRTLWDALKDCHGILDHANPPFAPETIGLSAEDAQDRRVFRQIAVRAHYEGYMKHEQLAIAKLRALESWRIPETIDYAAIVGLCNESRAKLMKIRPTTLAQAGRIDGVTPPEIALLQIQIARMNKNFAKAAHE